MSDQGIIKLNHYLIQHLSCPTYRLLGQCPLPLQPRREKRARLLNQLRRLRELRRLEVLK
jgi:hypothetical protein